MVGFAFAFLIGAFMIGLVNRQSYHIDDQAWPAICIVALFVDRPSGNRGV